MEDHELDDTVLAQIQRRVADFAGLRPPAWVLRSRAAQRANVRNMTPQQYAHLLASAEAADELQCLVEMLRVGETRFFRHTQSMDALAEVVAPALAGQTEVRAWSAGCATGEEAYTLAMLLRGLLPAEVKLQVLGTDISDAALAVARRGCYADAAVDRVPASMRAAFQRTTHGWEIASDIRNTVRFERHNLMEPYRGRPFHVVLCRNVLIYFDDNDKQRTVHQLLASIADAGWLLVGYSESLRGWSELDTIRPGVYQRHKRAQPVRASCASAPQSSRHDNVEHQPASAAATPAAHPARPQPGTTHVELRGSYDGAARIGAELAEVLASPHECVVIHADGIEFLDDRATAVLRRARAAARATGATFEIVGARPGVLRWLRRSGLYEELV